MPGGASGILMVFMPTISTFAISELLTMNNIKLFGTTIQENINNSMWNYGAALSLIMLFLLFITLGIPQGYTTVVLSHITFCLPYVILSVMPRLKQMNPNLYEAALDLGASPMQALRKVIIPEILPGMISGFMLAITMSIDDFAVTIFTIGNEGLETLSTFIYADARKGGLTPELCPLSTIIFVLVLVMLIIINRRSEKNKKK
jgi:spermidine/putrescine transport system permease protein